MSPMSLPWRCRARPATTASMIAYARQPEQFLPYIAPHIMTWVGAHSMDCGDVQAAARAAPVTSSPRSLTVSVSRAVYLKLEPSNAAAIP